MAESNENVDMDTLETVQVIECTVCFETLYSPVLQCPKGHLICSSCLGRVNNCPTCRGVLPNTPIRNLAIENLVIKCPNLKVGCQAKFPRRDRTDHLLNCEYRSRDYCCLIGLKKVGVECNKMIRKRELPLHMKDEHKLTLIENNEALISQELEIENPICQQKWFHVLFFSFGELFVLDCEIIPDQSGSGTSRIYWKCISASSVSMAQKFSVEMILFPTDMGISLKWSGKAISIDGLQEEDLNFFSLTINTLKEHTNTKNSNKLNWKLKIAIQRNNSVTSIQSPVVPVINMTSVKLIASVVPIFEGKYQFVCGDGTTWNEIVYSRNGSQWTRKVGNHFEYSFTFGKEVKYKDGITEVKSIIIVDNNKLIHREKLYRDFKFLRNRNQVEEFAENHMVLNITGGQKSYRRVYEKVHEQYNSSLYS